MSREEELLGKLIDLTDELMAHQTKFIDMLQSARNELRSDPSIDPHEDDRERAEEVREAGLDQLNEDSRR